MTSKQRAEIRKQANQLKAEFQIGAQELHESNLKAIEQAFNTKEIVKVKVNRQDKGDKRIVHNLAKQLETIPNVEVCGVIGATIILFRPLPEDKSKKGESRR